MRERESKPDQSPLLHNKIHILWIFRNLGIKVVSYYETAKINHAAPIL
jgi:hypothetical protein